MTPTSTFCRAQESVQLARAANEPLENVRRIALAAAKAWAVEATWAESREQGRVSVPRLHLSAQEQEDDRLDDASARDADDDEAAAMSSRFSEEGVAKSAS